MRLAFVVAGLASATAALIAAATIWLCVTEPAIVADALGNGHAGSVLKVAAALVVSALGHVVRHL